jgi:hypothetical protein
MSTDHDDELAVAEAFIVLAEMARERGLDRVADLGDLPPLVSETTRTVPRGRPKAAGRRSTP